MAAFEPPERRSVARKRLCIVQLRAALPQDDERDPSVRVQNRL